MSADASPAPPDTLDLGEAADRLGVGIEQARAMVRDDLLVPTAGTDEEPRFTEAAVEAVRLAGG